MLRSIETLFKRITRPLRKRKNRERSFLSQRTYLRDGMRMSSHRKESYRRNLFQRIFSRKVFMYASISAVVVAAAVVTLLLTGAFTPASGAMAGQSPTASATPGPSWTGPNPSSQVGVANGDPSESPTEEPSPSPTPTPTPTPEPIDLDAMVKKFFEVKPDKSSKYYNDIGYSTNTYNYTEDDVYLMAQIIHKEAHGESYTGKLAVGNVIMNRVLLRGYFGDTIKAVCTASGQFAYNPATKPDGTCKRAAREVLAYERWVVPQDIYYFKVASTNADWGSHPYAFRIGHHAFYKHNYPGRFHGTKAPDALFKRVYQWPTYGCKAGSRVKIVQRLLRSFSYTKIKVDGYFGKDMKEAVKDFQKKNKLDDDGICGPGTLKAMIKKYGIQKFAKDYKYKPAK